MQKIFKGMYRNKISITVLVVCIFQMSSFTGFAQIDENHDKIRTIVIDAGHGGKDSGARGKFSLEKDIALAISLKAGKYIEEKMTDVKVIYTRTTDVFPALHERAKIANDADADLFLSIHVNSNAKSSPHGTSSHVLGLHRMDENFDVAKRENSVILLEDDYEIHYESFDPNSPESYIMFSLMQNVYYNQSLYFGQKMQEQFREKARRKDRGVKQQGLLVLAQTSMPGVLIETGFISNPDEEKYLNSESGQDYIASAIFRAFRDYKEYIEGGKTQEETIAAINNKNEQATEPKPEISAIVATTPTAGTETNNESITAATDNTDDVKYKVQILYSAKPIDLSDKAFDDFNDVEEINVNGKYKYLVGAKEDYNEAVEYSKWVKSRHPDAFIVAVLDGKIIPLSEALELTKNKTN